jgi:LmbE family N-acetylglucosaminyl deacetylase
MRKIALAIAAHPDDIEFMMGGTLILLKQAGYELHYMNIANGCCGTATIDKDEIIAIRTEEARRAAASIGAVFHPPLVDDIEVYYERSSLAKVGAVVRQVNPQVILAPSPQDYMEDHMNASRLAVSAAFCRGMRNFAADPPTPPVAGDVALYHALPHGLRDQLRHPIYAEMYVDVSAVLGEKRRMLACHRSQKEWLDHSQGIDSYLKSMEDTSAEVGRVSGRFEYAEGWRRHLHLGFGPEDFDPLRDALGEHRAPAQ